MKFNDICTTIDAFFAFCFYCSAISIFFHPDIDIKDMLITLLIANSFAILIKLRQLNDKKGGAE